MTALVTPVGVQLLDQGLIWRAWDGEGRLVDLSLEDMTPGARLVVLAYLRRHADRVLGRAMDDLARQQLAGAIADDEFCRRALVLADAVGHAADWVEASPLVRRLEQLTPRRRRRYAAALTRLCRPRR